MGKKKKKAFYLLSAVEPGNKIWKSNTGFGDLSASTTVELKLQRETPEPRM